MEQFIQQLLQDKGVPADMEPEVREQLVAELTDRATDFINKRLVEAMSDEAVDHFNVLLDDANVNPEQVQEFIVTNVPNRDQVASQSLLEFRTLYLGAEA